MDRASHQFHTITNKKQAEGRQQLRLPGHAGTTTALPAQPKPMVPRARSYSQRMMPPWGSWPCLAEHRAPGWCQTTGVCVDVEADFIPLLAIQGQTERRPAHHYTLMLIGRSHAHRVAVELSGALAQTAGQHGHRIRIPIIIRTW